MKNNHSNPFVLIEYYYPQAGKEEAVLKIAEKSVNLMKDRSGIMLSQVLKSDGNKGPICNLTFYESKQSFNDFLKTDDFKNLLNSKDMANVKEWTTDLQAKMFNTVTGWHL